MTAKDQFDSHDLCGEEEIILSSLAFHIVHGPSSRDFRVGRKWRSSSRENDECVQATERR